MESIRRFPRWLIRGISLYVCAALIAIGLIGSSRQANAKIEPQHGRVQRKGPPPNKPGRSHVVLPNLQELKNRREDKPKIAAPVESTMRSRRKPLQPRRGLKVGDPLPRKKMSSGITHYQNPNANQTLPMTQWSLLASTNEPTNTTTIARDLFQLVKYESLSFAFHSAFGVNPLYPYIDSFWNETKGTAKNSTNDVGAMLDPALAPSPSSSVVIRQVYGGGGNSGATYKSDFIELFNRGDASVDLTGWSVQYAAATGSTWSVTALSGSLAAGHYYLVKEATGSGGTTDLPSPDASGNIDLNATAGKVAVDSTTTALSGSCPSSPAIVDIVGYGSTANCYEGNGAAPAPSNTTSIARASAGCIETDNNATDFDSGTVSPHNSASAANACSTPTGSSTIVISEFRTRGPNGGNDELGNSIWRRNRLHRDGRERWSRATCSASQG